MKIGELAEKTGTTTKTLRFYEARGLLSPARGRSSGYREFTPGSIARVYFIHRGQAAGLTLAEIRRILDIRDDGQAPCVYVRNLLENRLTAVDEQISKLMELRKNIAELRGHADVLEPEACDAQQVCRYL